MLGLLAPAEAIARARARAEQTNNYRDYEERLDTEVWDDEFLYRSVKADVHYEVDRYIERHRRPSRAATI